MTSKGYRNKKHLMGALLPQGLPGMGAKSIANDAASPEDR
jgi:hypothetical protein